MRAALAAYLTAALLLAASLLLLFASLATAAMTWVLRAWD